MRGLPADGNKIRTLRKDLDWTREDLALKSKLSLQVIGKMERGGTVDSHTLEKVASAFSKALNYGVTIHDLRREVAPVPGATVRQVRPALTSGAKWGIPGLPRLYARERLLEQLDRCHDYPCTWIAAPAGYGKTYLAKAYVDQAALPGLWYTLERGDSDVAAFFSDFSTGIEAVSAHWDGLPYSTDIQDISAFARAYFKHVFAQLEGPHLLVLDDYQVVAADAPLHAVVATAIDQVPVGTRLIVLSREAPPPALARAQMHGSLARLDAEDLRLTLAEAGVIAQLRSPQSVSESALKALHERADGWAAGFVLLLQQRGLSHVSHVTPESKEVLFRYFASEVLDSADAELRRFLLQTAWLPAMTSAMAEHMTAHVQADELLRSLAQGNYFVTYHPVPAPLYTYHELFRSFLLEYGRARLSSLEQEQQRKRAAAILEETGQLDAAVELWCALGDWERLEHLIGREAQALLNQARTETLSYWLSGIPQAVVDTRPWLQYWSARGQLYRDPLTARALFEAAYAQFQHAQDPEGVWLCWSAVCETYWLTLDAPAPLRHWLVELEASRARWPSFPSAEIEVQVAFGAFYALMANDPAHPQLGQWERRLLEALHSDQPADLKLKIANVLMFHYVLSTGDRGRAAIVLNILQSLADSNVVTPLNVIIARAWGDCSYEYFFGGSLDTCIRIAERTRVAAADWGAHLYDLVLLAELAYFNLTAGRVTEAHRYIQEFTRGFPRARPYDKGFLYFLLAWEAWLEGRLPEALAAAQEDDRYASHFAELHPMAMTRIMWTQIEASRGNRAAALRHLGELRQWAQRVGSTVFFGFARALALSQLALEWGRPQRADRVLLTAFALARQGGYVNFPFFRPETIARLCARALRAGIEVDYVRDMIRKRALKPPPDEAQSTELWP